MTAPHRVVYVAEGTGTSRVRHRTPTCVAPSPVLRVEVAADDSVWTIFGECVNCAKRDEPYEMVEP